jgi:quercetin dioxygenase-like cupin family protein
MTAENTARELDFLGSRVRILVDGDATEGRLGVIDQIDVPPGDMPPLHLHREADECFYVLEGEVTFYMPGVERRLGPGDFLHAPRGIPHTYRAGDKPGRWLVISQPAGFERFVADVSRLSEVTPERLATVAAEHDIEILAPPGTLP